MPLVKEIGPLSLKHLFAVAGFFATAVAIIVLTLFYRDMIVKDIVIQGERQNQLLAQTALNSVEHELIRFLQVVNRSDQFDPQKNKIPPRLKSALEETLANNFVTRIRIYSRNGTVVYTTAGADVDNEEHEAGFSRAIAGKVSSNLEFDDLFTFARKNREDVNLVESYLPVRERENAPILGVFEIYTNVQSIIDEVKHTEKVIIFGVILVLLILYGLLVLIVSRAANTIGSQQAVIRERTHTLELLSSQLINAQEDEKKKIAHDLHENIAQTLAGVKNVIETALNKQSDRDGQGGDDLKQSIRFLQESIGEIRSLAMELRPSLLDDFGLVKTLEWLCREYQGWFPNLSITSEFGSDEYPLSDEMKTIIYRVAQEALDSLSRQNAKQRIRLGLGLQGDEVRLSVEVSNPDADDTVNNMALKESAQHALSVIKQRTMLSGGSFDLGASDDGKGVLACACWLLVR